MTLPFHIVKRPYMKTYQQVIVRLLAVLTAFAVTSILMLLLKKNPGKVLLALLYEPVKNGYFLVQTIKLAVVLLIISLGIGLAFKMKFWNIGAEGQIILGGIGASYFGLFHSDWPIYILLPVMLVASFVTGGMYGLIPAYFKARHNTNETLFTLMLNYIALSFLLFLQYGPWKGANAMRPEFDNFKKNALLPSLSSSKPWSDLHIGWILSLVMVAVVYIYMNHTKSGYEISVVGESVNTARYAGMNVRWITLRTMMLSAGICGIAGFVQVSGNLKKLSVNVAGGLGFTAIIIAWLSKLNPVVMIVASFLFSVMSKGAGFLEYQNISPAASEMIQGIILFCVLGAEFFVNYKIVRTNREVAK